MAGLKPTYRKTPTVFQMECTECGAASLGMIMGYYGNHVPLDKLRVDTGVSRDGCRASKILAGAKKYGFDVEGRRMGLEALLASKAPCVIHWNFNHFVVYEGVKGGCAYINDPAMGRRKLAISELDEGFTGVALNFKPNEEFTKSKGGKRTFFSFAMQRLAGMQGSLAYLLLLGACLIFPGLVLPALSQVFVDDILLGGNGSWIGALVFALLFCSLYQAFFTFIRNRVLLRMQNKMALTSGYKFLHHMLRLPMSFFDQRYAGDLSERVENNDSVCAFISGGLAQNALNLFVCAFFLALLIAYSPALTLIGLSFVALNYVIMRLASERIERTVMKMQQDHGKMVGVLLSGISIMSTLKAAGIENQYTSRVYGYYSKSMRMEGEFGKLQQIINSVPELTDSACRILVLMIGGGFVIGGSMTLGALIAFNALLGSFSGPVNELVGFVQKIQKAKADMNRVHDIMSYQQDIKFLPGADPVPMAGKLSGQIRMEGVTFGYSPLDKPLIEKFEFQAKSGRNVAIVGASGCGKSTVSKLLSGLHTPWEGEIYMDGIPLRQVPAEVASGSISTVSQEVTLFSGTIRENITMWNKNIREEDIIAAAKDACIHDMITKKPGAYDFVLSEGGKNLSGGQRQRLEIARALVTNPTVLIMDEATSALDSITEKQIINNLKRRGCTCVIVAHRVSAIRDCDEILVLQRGKIVQRGTHESLYAVEGPYRKLINAS
ncbi:MAG: NHLP family bacteriocin export ABC transporter peptidase/permease/ATPase subunit [Clostridiales bacterium]|jgi:NHLM bacteriocin system ABC transporter peptidase/ATP-binding protein|nr:NHLP family bacteriocin export ABC transporter peptidase/permease/ATPase subunit [Clostridiales bacterium]